MLFKEVWQADGTVQYLIGMDKDSLKEISRDAFCKLVDDESLNSTKASNVKVVEDVNYGEFNDVVSFIKYLAQLPPESAEEIFIDIVEINRQEAYTLGCIETYDSISKMSSKLSARLEVELDNLYYEEEQED